MSSSSFKLKNGATLVPIDLTTLPNPEAGDLACDINDANKIKRYNTLSSSWQELGSGSSGINYLAANSDFEAGTTGYSTYADAAAAVPVDGTGGTANITFTATTVSPLRGTRSGLITKDAANRQGQGVSYNFNIDPADQAQVLRFSFDYQTSANYADGDVRIYIYDVTNNQIVEVIDRDLPANNFGKFVGSFQTNSTSTSYRAIWHVASSNAASYTVEIDNVVIGPQAITKGAIVTDWQSYTPTLNSNTSVSSQSFFWRRVGDSIEVQGTVQYSGVGAATDFTFTLPSGLSSDATRIPANGIASTLGYFQWYDDAGSAASRNGMVERLTATSFFLRRADTSNPLITNVLAANDRITLFAKVPIQGWSSNMVLSEDFGNRLVMEGMRTTTATSVNHTSLQKVLLNTIIHSTTASSNVTSNRIDVPESGYYRVTANVSLTSGANAGRIQGIIYRNGAAIAVNAAAGNNQGNDSAPVSWEGFANKGDFFELYVINDTGATATIVTDSSLTYMYVSKISSPQTIVSTASTEELHSSNFIINGSFDYWQRGTSFTAIAANTYCADRWQYTKGGTMVQTISRSTDVPAGAFGSFSLLATTTTAQTSIAAGDFCDIRQSIEGNVLRTFKGKKIALSFWVKSNKTGTTAVSCRNNAATRSIAVPYTINAANTWEKKIVRLSHDSTGVWEYGTGAGLVVRWSQVFGSTFQTSTLNQWQDGNFAQPAGSINFVDTIGNTFQLADVCLVEDNETQTRNPDFVLAGRDLAEELQLCQRYYSKSYSLNTNPGTIVQSGSLENRSSGTTGAASVYFYAKFPVDMRTNPIVTTYSTATGASGQLRDIDGGVDIAAATSGLNEKGTNITNNVALGGTFRRCFVQYTADAEL